MRRNIRLPAIAMRQRIHDLTSWGRRQGLPKHLRIVSGVGGMMSLDEADTLYGLARECEPEQCIVEVGSYRGRSTVALALGSQAGGGSPVFAIDPHEAFIGALGGVFGWEDRESFMRNVVKAGCARTVRLVNLASEAVAPNWRRPVGILFLDGDHTYEGVKHDLEMWRPHLTSGAVLALDDSTDVNLGPYQLIERDLIPRHWEVRGVTGKLTVLASNI